MRGSRPLRGSVKIAAAAARRSASELDAGARASSGNRNAGSAYFSCATSQRYSCSFGSGEKYAASEYASFSFHLLTKLSWQELHLRLMPRKTCAVFCDACIHGVTAALVSPRQFTPIRKPSGSPGAVGLSSFVTNWSYGRLDVERGRQPVRDALAAGGLGEIGHAVLVAQQIVPERDPVLGVLLDCRRAAPATSALALGGAAVGEEGLQLLRRRQQAPDVEIHAPREQRVGDRRGSVALRAAEIRRDEAIERRVPRPARTRPAPRGRVERQRRFPRRRRRRGRRRARARPGRSTSGSARSPPRVSGSSSFGICGSTRAGEPMDDQAAARCCRA